MAMEQTELLKLIEFLRANGVTHYEAGGVKLVLGPVDKLLEKDEAKPVDARVDPIYGLSAADQRDIFGHVVSDPE